MNERRRNTNSPIAAALVPIGIVFSVWWLGWPGALVYTVGFAVGGFGTTVNMRRSRYVRLRP